MNDAVASERLEPASATRLDIIVFFAAFLGGLLLYFALRWLGVSQLIQTVVIVAVMFAYAIVVAQIPRLRVRLDQAGDNAYYLGLLFTLCSMAVALYEFSAAERSGAEQIIANFGIALGSTIAGIFLRVVLHQMRVDPADVESMTRIELSDASKRVKASLDTVAGDLALFHSEIRQRLTDVIATVTDEYRNALTTFTGDVSNATHKLLSGTEEVQQGVIARASNITEKLDGAAESARASIERLRAVEPPPLLLAKRLNKVCESLEGLGAPIQALTERFQQTEQATAEAIRTIATASQQLVEITRESREHNTTILRHIADAAQSFQGSLAAAGVALQNDRTVLQQLQVDVRKSADESHRAREAANATLQTFTDVAKDVATIIRAAGPRDPGSHT